MEPKQHKNSLNQASKEKKKDKDGSEGSDLDMIADNRKRQFAFTAMLLTFISVAVMILSIVANDNFGDNYAESFQMVSSNLPYKNASLSITPKSDIDLPDVPTFNDKGYIIEKKCPF